MFSRFARMSLGALVALLSVCSVTTLVHAAELKANQKCSAAIIKAGATFLQAEAKILQKCRDTTLKGKKACDAGKTQASIDKARTKLATTISKACGGKDKVCNTADADNSQPLLADVGWTGPCPGFEGQCTNAITDCDDISACIQCISEASVNQAIDLYYPPNRASSADNKTLNKCQASLGKAAVTFFTAKSKALSKCWGTKVKKTANCPADAQAKIDKARSKLDTTLAKACVGLDNSTIGLPAGCLAVGTCGNPVTSLIDVGNCTECVTEFKVDCPDRASSASVGAAYPAECLIVPPTPTPTATTTPVEATPTPTASATPSPTPTQNALCGNGQLDGGEQCDATSAQAACPNVDPADYPCSGLTCTCACPTKVTFAGDPTDPKSILDTGWTGISHRAPIISNGNVTVALSCEAGGRPCGVCNVSGPIANTLPNQLRNQRCTNDTSIKCTDNTPCTPGGGTCQFFFGSSLPLAAGGVSTCVVNQFKGSVSGTANVETGEASTTALLSARVFNGLAVDNPCPRCIGDAVINDDGATTGTCDSGLHAGDPCDGNGTIPSRPDFGTTSLDCPFSVDPIATLPIDLTNRTAPVTRTLTTASPDCTGLVGEKCLCDTCNNLNADPCLSNADCPVSGGAPGICGGRRCRSGPNNGTPCGNNTECPSGSCSRPGLASRPSACADDTTVSDRIMECDDGDGDGEGDCTFSPPDQNCTVASGHAQRACTTDDDCGDGTPGSGAPGSCEIVPRHCFLTGGGTADISPTGNLDGTNTLTAVGEADPPVNDVSNPTLGAVFCVGPTALPAVNTVAGLPGPARVTIKGTAEGLP